MGWFVFSRTGDDCRNIILWDPIPNMAVRNHVMRSAEVSSKGSCRVMCYMEPNCVSIYIGLVEGGNQQCELNNATEKNHAPFLLVNKEGYTYLEIEVNCTFLSNWGESHTNLGWGLKLFFPNRIHAVAAHVWTMAPVKLDSPIKVFVAFVVMDSVEITASSKLNSTNGVFIH